MNKTEWIEEAAERAGVKKTIALEVLTAGLNIIIEELANGKRVQLSEFGSFLLREKTAANKERRRPNAKGLYFTRDVDFKGSKSLIERINRNNDAN